jgi:hypothetical protein
MKLKLRKFDASEHLDKEEVNAEYLTARWKMPIPKYFYRPLVMLPRRAE